MSQHEICSSCGPAHTNAGGPKGRRGLQELLRTCFNMKRHRLGRGEFWIPSDSHRILYIRLSTGFNRVFHCQLSNPASQGSGYGPKHAAGLTRSWLCRMVRLASPLTATKPGDWLCDSAEFGVWLGAKAKHISMVHVKPRVIRHERKEKTGSDFFQTLCKFSFLLLVRSSESPTWTRQRVTYLSGLHSGLRRPSGSSYH